MPYGDLVAQRAERFATFADLERFECTIEEREEYEPHIMEGTTVYAGVDYEDILHQAEQEGDIILWDGGNNDTSFYKPDLDIVVLDPHRRGTRACVLSRGSQLPQRARADHQQGRYRKSGVDRRWCGGTSRSTIPRRRSSRRPARSAWKIRAADQRQASAGGRRRSDADARRNAVRGGSGRGQSLRCGEAGRSAAVCGGIIQKTFEKFPHLGKVLPAMGYSEIQRHELEETIRRVPCDVVLVATPIDLAKAIRLDKPNVRVRYEVEEMGRPAITELLEQFTESHKPAAGGRGR